MLVLARQILLFAKLTVSLTADAPVNYRSCRRICILVLALQQFYVALMDLRAAILDDQSVLLLLLSTLLLRLRLLGSIHPNATNGTSAGLIESLQPTRERTSKPKSSLPHMYLVQQSQLGLARELDAKFDSNTQRLLARRRLSELLLGFLNAPNRILHYLGSRLLLALAR